MASKEDEETVQPITMQQTVISKTAVGYTGLFSVRRLSRPSRVEL